MAVGDDATAAGFPLVPDTGSDDAKVKNGAKEINRTRDLIANVKSLVPASSAQFRTASGITVGTATPAASYGQNGDIYLKYI